jgi:hypothetical protein
MVLRTRYETYEYKEPIQSLMPFIDVVVVKLDSFVAIDLPDTRVVAYFLT